MGDKKEINDKQMLMILCFATGALTMLCPIMILNYITYIATALNKEVFTLLDSSLVAILTITIFLCMSFCYKALKCFIFDWKHEGGV